MLIHVAIIITTTTVITRVGFHACFSNAYLTMWTWTGLGVQKERKDWHRVVCGITGLRDRVMASIVKGDRVFVMGSIQYREMMDENGNRTSSTYISAGKYTVYSHGDKCWLVVTLFICRQMSRSSYSARPKSDEQKTKL